MWKWKKLTLQKRINPSSRNSFADRYMVNMRIALFSSNFIDYSINLANALVDKNVKVLLIVPDWDIHEFAPFINPKLELYIYSQPRLYYPQNFILLANVIKRLSLFEPDVIHIQGGILWLSIILPFLSRMKYTVTTLHDVEPHPGDNHFWRRVLSYVARHFSHEIIVHGTGLKEILIYKFNLDERRVHAIPIGEHNVALFLKYKQNEMKETDNLVLFFGRIFEYKGLKYLIEAEPLITREVPEAKIIIAGKGDNFEKYAKLIRHKDNFIVYNHYITYEEGARLFQQSSVVVLPYIEASQSGVISTAYGFMKPVVVTNVGSIPEIVDNGITGLIVPPKDPAALAEAIIKLLKDKNLRLNMGKAAHKKLKTDMSWNKIAEKTINVYEGIHEHL